MFRGNRAPNIAPAFGSRTPYSPRIQGDQASLESIRSRGDEHFIPWQEAIAFIEAKNLPPQINQVAYNVVATGSALPILPRNENRMSLLLVNTNAARGFTFSFEAPSGGIMVPIGAGNIYQETNGTVSINEIWVNATAGDVILAYEGTLSLTGNKL